MKPRVSTRDQILEALSESPAGLTLKELAEFCSACEHDEQIVGTMIAILQRDNVIHAAPEPRDGATVWVFGKAPVDEHQPPISLAGADSKPKPSEAARAIAEMRQTSTRTRGHAAPSKPAPVLTVRAKIERVLRENGPMRSCDIAERLTEKDIGNHCSSLAQRKILIRLGGNKRGTIYGLPGQTLKDGKTGDTQPAKGRDPASLSRGANGGGGAVTPVAGPATTVDVDAKATPPADHGVIKVGPELHVEAALVRQQHNGNGDNLYQAALLDLHERRTAALEQIAKIDRAIEAMRELA